MRLYTISEHPLRVYLEDEQLGEVQRLMFHLDNKYSPEKDDCITSMRDDEDEVTSLIFFDDELEKYYIVHGLLSVILKEARSINIPCSDETKIEESSIVYPDIDKNLLDGITLREYQIEGISSSLAHKRGLIQVHTGGGKTEMMIGVCRYLLDNSDSKVLICVPSTNLLYQTYGRMVKRGVSENNISLLGDGNQLDTSCRVCISTVQSAYSRLSSEGDQSDWLKSVDCLMLDEAHHSKCRTWSTVIDRISPEYLLGFSAEPFHRDKDHLISDLILRGIIGPVIHRVTVDYLVDHGYLSKPYVVAMDSKYAGNIYHVIDWKLVNKSCIVKNSLRNTLIRDIAATLINKDKKPLILVQQISHGQELAASISKLGYNVTMMKGGLSVTKYLDGNIIDTYTDSEGQVVKDFNEGKIDALIGTSTLDEGVDIPALSAVILAGGGKGRIRVLQRLGRSIRKKPGLNVSYVIDFRDRFNVVTNSHFKKRKSLYDELRIPVYYATSQADFEGIVQSIEYERSIELGLRLKTPY